jgi:phosphomevalonate kinase
MADIKDLFEAYSNSELPSDNGYIVSIFFDSNSNYTRFEIISYGNVKDIYTNDEGIIFQADGRKLFLLYEPISYAQKQIEPCYRDDRHKIPYRFKELDIFKTKRQDRVYLGKEPVDTYTSFTILNEGGFNQSFIVYKDETTADTIAKTILMTLWKNLKISKIDSEKVADMVKNAFPKLLVNFGFDGN